MLKPMVPYSYQRLFYCVNTHLNTDHPENFYVMLAKGNKALPVKRSSTYGS